MSRESKSVNTSHEYFDWATVPKSIFIGYSNGDVLQWDNQKVIGWGYKNKDKFFLMLEKRKCQKN